MSPRAVAIAAFVVWATMITPISIVAFTQPALLRSGPVTIEQPKDGRFTYPAPSTREIVRIEADGKISRRGVAIESVHRSDLIEIIRELMALELLKSAPPGLCEVPCVPSTTPAVPCLTPCTPLRR